MLSLIPSHHPFLILFLPKMNPPIKKERMVKIVNRIFNVVEESQPIY